MLRKTIFVLLILCPIMISPVLSWNLTSSLAEPDINMIFSTNGYIYAFSLPLGVFHYQYSKASLITGLLGTWTLVTDVNLQEAIYKAGVVSDSTLYLSGGFANFDLTEVVAAPIHTDGSLGNFTTVSSLITPRGYHAMASNNGYLYAIGGYNNQGPFDTEIELNSVEYAKISTNGTLGPWQNTLSMITVSTMAAAWVSQGYLWALGQDRPLDHLLFLEKTPINSDGTLGGWVMVTTHPFVFPAGSVTYGSDSYVYQLYGEGTVQRVQPHTDGSLTGLEILEPLSVPRPAFIASYSNFLYAMDGGPSLTTVEYRFANGVFIDKWNDMETKPRF